MKKIKSIYDTLNEFYIKLKDDIERRVDEETIDDRIDTAKKSIYEYFGTRQCNHCYCQIIHATSGTIQHHECCKCGDLLVEIRGKYPKEDKRKVCPTCTYERLEEIHKMTDPNYGQAYKD